MYEVGNIVRPEAGNVKIGEASSTAGGRRLWPIAPRGEECEFEQLVQGFKPPRGPI